MRVRYGSGRSRTPALCPLNVCTSEPSLQLHRQTVASPEALASLCAWPTPLSGGSAWVQSTESEGGGWSRAGRQTGTGAGSHHSPSGEKVTDAIALVCPPSVRCRLYGWYGFSSAHTAPRATNSGG